METITLKDFLCKADDYVVNAALDNDYITIATEKGNAVLISEAEYNIFRESFKKLTGSVEADI